MYWSIAAEGTKEEFGMVRNLLSLKCQTAGARQFVCPALPVPEGLRDTSVPCHGHQLCPQCC